MGNFWDDTFISLFSCILISGILAITCIANIGIWYYASTGWPPNEWWNLMGRLSELYRWYTGLCVHWLLYNSNGIQKSFAVFSISIYCVLAVNLSRRHILSYFDCKIHLWIYWKWHDEHNNFICLRDCQRWVCNFSFTFIFST